MTRVLLVDDEPMILRAMERVFRRERNWHTVTCSGGLEALRALEAEPVDIIVSDLNMPGMDGITLLELVRDRHPEVARFVLSGHSNHADALRAAAVAHQFFAKPFNSDRLRQTIARVMTLRAAVSDPDARVQTAWMRHLPPLPKTFGAITMAVENRNASTRSIAALIERDVGLSTKVLQVVNGAYFGLGQRVTGVEKAVMLLGTNVIRALVLSQEMFQAFSGSGPGPGAERLQQHSLRAAALARRIADNRGEGDTAFTAALLHDVGRLVLTSLEQKRKGQAASTADHADVGACLLALWGIPEDIVEAVDNHHRPARAPEASRRLTALVHVVDVLEKELAGETPEIPLDEAFLQEMGMADKLEGWRQLAKEEMASQ
jgi:putative nucleotidyltransferase with HDIG domain